MTTPTTPTSRAAGRVLFVSSTVGGGSGRSQRELASRLEAAGREVVFLVDDTSGARGWRRVLDELDDAAVRFDGSILGRIAERIRGTVGARTRNASHGGRSMLATPAPENAFARVLDEFAPDAVVASSISRTSWRRIRQVCLTRGIPTVLYVREASARGHLDKGLTADRLVANARSLVELLRDAGGDAQLIPSVVEVTASDVAPDRDHILLVNPIESHGIGLIDAIAPLLGDRPILLQQSWDLDAAQQRVVDGLVARHPNVTYRERVADASELFAGAGLLLVPHRIDNRPRTIHEAQSVGIAVVAADQPGLIEATGPGGEIVAQFHRHGHVVSSRTPPAMRRFASSKTFVRGLENSAPRV